MKKQGITTMFSYETDETVRDHERFPNNECFFSYKISWCTAKSWVFIDAKNLMIAPKAPTKLLDDHLIKRTGVYYSSRIVNV